MCQLCISNPFPELLSELLQLISQTNENIVVRLDIGGGIYRLNAELAIAKNAFGHRGWNLTFPIRD